MPTAALPLPRLRTLARALHDSPGESTTSMVGVELDADEVALHLAPLDGDPALSLRGFTAPASWAALGLTAPARLWRWPAGEPGMGPPEDGPTPCRLTVLVARHGPAAALYGESGSPAVSTLRRRVDQRGRLTDALRRGLGLATAPPECSTAALWHACWADRLVARALDPQRSGALSAAEAILAHPAVELLDRCSAAAIDDAASLALVAEDLSEAWPWPRLRRAVAGGILTDPEITCDDARWLDVGSFARACLEPFPEHAALVDTLREVASPAVAELVATVRPAATSPT